MKRGRDDDASLKFDGKKESPIESSENRLEFTVEIFES